MEVLVLAKQAVGHVEGCFFTLSGASMFFISQDIGPSAQTHEENKTYDKRKLFHYCYRYFDHISIWSVQTSFQ